MLENKPTEQKKIHENNNRTDCRVMLSARIACVIHRNTDGEDCCADDPDQNLNSGDARQIERGVEPVEYSEQEQRYPAQQVEMGVSGHRRMVLRDRHNNAPGHSDCQGCDRYEKAQ